MIDKNRLQAKCSTWNIPLTGAQLDLLDRYAELLVSYNEKVNLTAITSPEGIEDRHFAKERAEEAARKIWREQFDVASARAVAALPVLCEYCLPLVKVGGRFIAMKGPEADAEAKAAANALKKLGGQYEETRAFTLPDGSARGLVFCKKISQTPTVYPRNGGKIAKKPL